jgi:cysteine desulfurase
MGVPADEALATVRFSMGRTTTLDDINSLLNSLPPLLAPLLRDELMTAP